MDIPNIYHELGALIRRRRRVLDLTQGDLADRLGISRGGLANIETGRQNILVHQLYRFAAALDMNVHDLLPLPKEINVRDLLPAEKGAPDRYQSRELPMPKGLTSEQKAQVARVFSSAVTRRTTTAEGE
ncbi:MAG: helix-turn-helix transcriptional regulator [Acetobacteraceae bacterium]|jgi:transcriptional regulator with XRE-family HTH domain